MANTNKKIVAHTKATEQKDEAVSKLHVTVKQMPDGTFEFSGGKGGFNIIVQKNKALEPYGKCIWNYGVVLELIPGEKQSAINQQIGNAMLVHNNYLRERKEYYNQYKKALTVSQYQKDYLPKLKEECDYLKTSDKFIYENA